MARSRPLKDQEIIEIRDRLRFLETVWGCRTDYSMDLSTGRGSLTITPDDGGVALFLGNIDFRLVGLPEAYRPDRKNPQGED
jgi:hypothetical protein